MDAMEAALSLLTATAFVPIDRLQLRDWKPITATLAAISKDGCSAISEQAL